MEINYFVLSPHEIFADF